MTSRHLSWGCMGFTIGGTFDHLFGHGAVPNNVDYEQRRWFRRAGASGETAEVTTKAETLLVSHVDACTIAWAKANRIANASKFNRLRHLPPRTPYDVFALAAYLIEQAGIYHHIQPQKILAD